jgi:hypothetical protein
VRAEIADAAARAVAAPPPAAAAAFDTAEVA